MSSERKILRFRIRGVVQGVGFRYFTRQQAQRLGVAGWVRNLADSSVEAHAEGSADAIEAFREALERGPVGGRVDSVTATEAGDERATSFRIVA